MSNQQPIVLGVDLDGVCADFYAEMRRIAAEWLEVSIDQLTEDVTFGLKEWGIQGDDQYKSLHRFAVIQRELFRGLPMVPGARRVLRHLSDDGYRVRIITHRLFVHFFHATAVHQTIEWLDHHGIPYWDLCFMKEKDQVGADIYIDDAPHNVESLRRRGLPTICFANSTNKHIGAPRAKNWDEVYELVQEIAPIHAELDGSISNEDKMSRQKDQSTSIEMTTPQYLAALEKLRLTPASRETAETLGLSVRQCQRIAAGDSPVPETLERLLRAYLAHGVPKKEI